VLVEFGKGASRFCHVLSSKKKRPLSFLLRFCDILLFPSPLTPCSLLRTCSWDGVADTVAEELSARGGRIERAWREDLARESGFETQSPSLSLSSVRILF
jgi:hypothetical protein